MVRGGRRGNLDDLLVRTIHHIQTCELTETHKFGPLISLLPRLIGVNFCQWRR